MATKTFDRVTSGIAYLDSSNGELPLICLHGIQGSKESYISLLSSPLSRSGRLIIPDLPGFGASEMPDDETWELDRQAERIVGFIDALKIGRLAVYGHSLGGMLGTLLLERIPDRIICLISSEGNLRLADCGESRRVAAMNFEDFKTTRYPELRKRGVRTSALGFHSTASSVVRLSESGRLLTLLTESPCPVLFIRGGASHFDTVPMGSRIRNVVIPAETHFTLPESRGSIEAISRFLSEMSG
jgi:pimeloyl-ACP methyl ester carboxylesterase